MTLFFLTQHSRKRRFRSFFVPLAFPLLLISTPPVRLNPHATTDPRRPSRPVLRYRSVHGRPVRIQGGAKHCAGLAVSPLPFVFFFAQRASAFISSCLPWCDSIREHGLKAQYWGVSVERARDFYWLLCKFPFLFPNLQLYTTPAHLLSRSRR